jgi:hypothetical protein
MKITLATFTCFFSGALLFFTWVACARTHADITEERKRLIGAFMRDINEVMNAHVNELMALPGVVGVFIGALDNGTPCIKVMVIKASPELDKKIPRDLEGHPVLIVETGEIKPLSEKSRSA